MHSSITIHLAANYPIKQPVTPFLKDSAGWGPNLELFHERFDPEKTAGQGPYWLKNLYFVYLLELRALAKASHYLSQQSYFTGEGSHHLPIPGTLTEFKKKSVLFSVVFYSKLFYYCCIFSPQYVYLLENQ